MTKYRITDTTGNQAIDAGSDIAAARVQAQSYADKWGTESYLCESGAAGDDFETFEFADVSVPADDRHALTRDRERTEKMTQIINTGNQVIDADSDISDELSAGIAGYCARIEAMGDYGRRIGYTTPDGVAHEGILIELGVGGCQPGLRDDDGRQFAILDLDLVAYFAE
jgi:hypothetical protein